MKRTFLSLLAALALAVPLFGPPSVVAADPGASASPLTVSPATAPPATPSTTPAGSLAPDPSPTITYPMPCSPVDSANRQGYVRKSYTDTPYPNGNFFSQVQGEAYVVNLDV